MNSTTQHLTGFEKWKAVVAKWIVLNIACRISPLTILSLCLETSKLYYDSIEPQESEYDNIV